MRNELSSETAESFQSDRFQSDRLMKELRQEKGWRLKRLESFLPISFGWVALIFGLVGTTVITALLTGVLRQERQGTLERSAIEIQHRLEERFRLYELSLSQIQAFALSQERTIRQNRLSDFEDAFASYVADLDVMRVYPGSRGVGLLEKVPAQKKEEHTHRVRERLGALYRIWPESGTPVAFPMVRLEPKLPELGSQNFGLDHATDPVRAAALSASLSSGRVTASAPTRFVPRPDIPEGQRSWGLLLYAPLFSSKAIPRSLAEREKALLGYVFTSFRFDYLMPRTIPPPLPPMIERIQLVPGLGNPLVYFDSAPSEKVRNPEEAFDLNLNLPGNERALFLRVFPKPIGFLSYLNWIPALAAFFGVLLSLFMWREVQMRERLSVALEKGIDLRTSQLHFMLEEQKRTNADLKLLNEDLESFGYSVSHDLRAPLRGIDGFGAALEEEYAEVLTGNGKKYVGFIRQGAKRAAQVLDDLLRLSRLSRTEPEYVNLNLRKEAEEIISAFRQSEPERNVEFVSIGELDAYGDSGLVRIALENLLSNAWKFTRNQAVARITLREGNRSDGQVRFQVEDNGAGFPAEYSKQLFGVFSRLHSEKEFPGTGVGLATVKRVVMKHGGQVWAENRPEGGAIFGFTLPEAPKA